SAAARGWSGSGPRPRSGSTRSGRATRSASTRSYWAGWARPWNSYIRGTAATATPAGPFSRPSSWRTARPAGTRWPTSWGCEHLMLSNARVVLVRPHYAGNVGAVARVMRNFGLTQLTLVAPYADHWSKEARRMATQGEQLLETATIVPTLDDAVADCRKVLGSSANVEGIYRTHNYGRPDELLAGLSASLADGPSALVFGPEPSGLSNAEIARCHGLIRIPTDSQYPSLNLS